MDVLLYYIDLLRLAEIRLIVQYCYNLLILDNNRIPMCRDGYIIFYV